MVFCYKTITESPRRSGSASPRKSSPSRSLELGKSMSNLLATIEDQYDKTLLNEIPEKEWRLLSVLAKKRGQELEREKTARDCQKLWAREKEQRDLLTAISYEQYKRYLHEKRESEQFQQQIRSYQRDVEAKMRQAMLKSLIHNKDKRSELLFNWVQEQKANELIERALEKDAREVLAADRRARLSVAGEWKRQMQFQDRLEKIDMANKRRNMIIRDAAQRVAISNALSHWESTLLRKEKQTLDEYKRAQHAAHIELTNQRAAQLAYARDWRIKRARKMAVLTEQLRDCVRMSGRL